MKEILEQIIESAPESADFKPSRIGVRTAKVGGRNIRFSLGYPAWGSILYVEKLLKYGAESDRDRKLLENWRLAQERGLVSINDRRVYLLPVEPDTTSKSGGDYGLLIHRGLITNGSDNRENLQKYGVWGNLFITAPTYLTLPGSCIATFSQDAPSENKVLLGLDKKELLKKRSVFIDPETIEEDQIIGLDERLGNSFMVFEGIPKEAITEIRTYR